MTIRIFLDRFHLLGVSGGVEVSRAEQFGPACSRIDEELSRGGSIDIVITNPAMHTWFDHYKGLKQVSLLVLDPVDMLSQELGVPVDDLPKEIRESPSTVASMGLVQKARARPRNMEPIEWLRSEVCGSLWAGPLDTAGDLTRLVRALSVEDVFDAASIEGLMRRARAREWAAESPFGSVVSWLLSGDSTRRAQTLAANRLLLRYPEAIRIKAMQFDGRWSDLCQLKDADVITAKLDPAELSGVALSPGQSRVLRGYIDAVLRERRVDEFLSAVSGYLMEEVEGVKSFIGELTAEIDGSWGTMLGRMIEVFSRSEAGSDLVSFLRRVMPVSEPAPLGELASWEEVRAWLAEQYFPYHEWALAVGCLERTTTAVGQFERWLYANYYELTKTSAFAPYALREALQRHIPDSRVVLIVVDGLPWSYCRELHSLLEGRGLTSILPEPVITTLPSKTDTAKPSLVRCQLPGQIGGQDEVVIPYGELFASSLGLRPCDVEVGTATESSLQDLLKSQRRAYLYLCNDLDAIIHKPLPPEKRREQILKVLANLCEDIAEARQGFMTRYGEEPVFILSSDHGFTELPKPAKILSLSVADERQLSHCRVLESPWPAKADEDALTVGPDMLGGGKVAYVVPRGYTCINSRPKGATHGGLTPQETVVPVWVIGSTEGLLYSHVEVAIVGDVYRGRPANPVQIILANPNCAGVWVDSIDVDRLVTSQRFPVLVPAGSDLKLEGLVNGVGLKQATLTLRGVVRVRFAGADKRTPLEQTVPTRGAAVSDESFEREFEE